MNKLALISLFLVALICVASATTFSKILKNRHHQNQQKHKIRAHQRTYRRVSTSAKTIDNQCTTDNGEEGTCTTRENCPEENGFVQSNSDESLNCDEDPYSEEGCCVPPTVEDPDNGGDTPIDPTPAEVEPTGEERSTVGAVMDCNPGETKGTCYDTLVSQCNVPPESERCPGKKSKCCTGEVSRRTDLDAIYTFEHQKFLCFPLAKNDFTENNSGRTQTGFIQAESFSQNREYNEEGHARRCHKGLDMFTGGVSAKHMTHGQVLSVYHGVVTSIITQFTQCKDGWYFDAEGVGHKVPGKTWAYAVVVYHEKLGFEVTYGELTFTHVEEGDTVVPGQLLGQATICEMLHFEIWDKGTRRKAWWGPSDTDLSPCCPNDNSPIKPAHNGLRNPRAFLRMLQGQWCDPVIPTDPYPIKKASQVAS